MVSLISASLAICLVLGSGFVDAHFGGRGFYGGGGYPSWGSGYGSGLGGIGYDGGYGGFGGYGGMNNGLYGGGGDWGMGSSSSNALGGGTIGYGNINTDNTAFTNNGMGFANGRTNAQGYGANIFSAVTSNSQNNNGFGGYFGRR